MEDVRMISINRTMDLRRKAKAKKPMSSCKRELIVRDVAVSPKSTNLAKVINRFEGRLEKISFWSIECNGDHQSMLAKALSGCRNLRELSLASVMIDPKLLGEALLQMPSLDTINLDNLDNIAAPRFPCPLAILTPVLLLPNSALSKITLKSFPTVTPTNEEFRLFCRACQTSAALRQLRMLACFRFWQVKLDIDRDVETMMDLTLAELAKNMVNSDRAWSLGLAKALKLNNSLRCLYIDFPTPRYRFYDDSVYSTMAHAKEVAEYFECLKHNYILEELYICPWMRYQEVNSELTDWEFVESSYEGFNTLSEELKSHLVGIYFLLSLNKTGRGKVLGPSSNKPKANEWIEAITDRYDDLSVVYFFLRNNPSLCNPVPKMKNRIRRAGVQKHSLHSREPSERGGNKRQRTSNTLGKMDAIC